MVTFILFIISLATLVGLLGFQAYQIRAGEILVGDVDPEIENPLSKRNLSIYKSTVSSWLEARTRKIILYALRFSIKLGYFVKSKLDAIVSGVHRKMATHERKLKQEEGNGETGAFLKTISDYKGRIGRLGKNKKEEESTEA